jgi:hypothetical protein
MSCEGRFPERAINNQAVMRGLKYFPLFIMLFSAASVHTLGYAQTLQEDPFPFSTNDTHITVWNGEDYSPLFIKGINLGVSVPGTFAGELAAGSDDYMRWFGMIRDAGFNTIRVYTLHFPRFYRELHRFNSENPSYPLYLFQGVWLEEEVNGYDNNLFSLSGIFEQEISENVSAVHGDITISSRQGKAYGTYDTDISPWVIGYIIGREIHPPEVLHTNESNPGVTSYTGNYLSIEQSAASESWLTARLDYLLTFEMDNYGTQRPVSASSWPTLDPLDHPFEENTYETSASIDFSEIDFSEAKAGFFVSYHAYPYYPNYISRDPKYTSFQDHLGQNSYLGYLTYLKQHYSRFPLIIAEFGGSSSWGVAKYAQSGIHHGGYSEAEQGKNNIRMLKNIHQSGGGGGIQFSWIDEWFKQTWITNPFDFDINRRVLWHNVTAAEQNYGLLGFRKSDREPELWQEFGLQDKVTSLSAKAGFAYFKLSLGLQQHIAEDDTLWISFDTYDESLGESILPSGDQVSNRVEFALMITNYSAKLYVTEAYDLFGIWHGVSSPEQLYRSVPSDGAPWRLVRWKNDVNDEEAQDIGRLGVNRLNVPKKSTDAVFLYNDRIDIRLPWSLLQFTDPSRLEVMHDDRSEPETGTRISDGISIGIFYNDFTAETFSRFTWEPWNSPEGVEEYKKMSYYIIQEYLNTLPGNPIAVTDYYRVGVDGVSHISAEEGVLANDLSPGGSAMEAVLVQPPLRGLIQLRSDGSFSYAPETGFAGEDAFVYRVRDGANWSDPVHVHLEVEGTPIGAGFVSLYPNPSNSQFTIRSSSVIDHIDIYNIMGQRIYGINVHSTRAEISLPSAPSGVYFARIYSGNDAQIKKFMIVK